MLLPIVVFFAVTSAVIGGLLLLAPDRTDQRIRALSGNAELGSQSWHDTVVRVVTPFAKLSTPSGEWETSPMRLKFIQAGIRQPKAPHVFFGLKTLLPFLFGVPVYLVLRGMQNI